MRDVFKMYMIKLTFFIEQKFGRYATLFNFRLSIIIITLFVVILTTIIILLLSLLFNIIIIYYYYY